MLLPKHNLGYLLKLALLFNTVDAKTYAIAHFDETYSTIHGSIESFSNSKDGIILSECGSYTDRTFTFIDTTNGNIVQVSTRSRSEGYLIPRAYSDVASRLKDLGLEAQTLPYEYRGRVEKTVDLPVKSFWISKRQRSAGVAFTALEPEGKDSYVSFELVSVSEGDEYPIFQVPRH
ncbi:hypothetical protein IWW34DRAFT_810311 [Fusarium oxysporum f. sp. albedinis]|nr:hypothetical protein IWW34DRAFT_810311 [Fusarium oxysporum f. sp. albedinis]